MRLQFPQSCTVYKIVMEMTEYIETTQRITSFPLWALHRMHQLCEVLMTIVASRVHRVSFSLFVFFLFFLICVHLMVCVFCSDGVVSGAFDG